MPSERKPKTQVIHRGGRTYRIDPDAIREREGTVDAKGMRTITLFKDPENKAFLAQQLRWYRSQGYEVTDDDYEFTLKIDDKTFKEREAQQHTQAKKLLAPKKPTVTNDDGKETEEIQHLTPSSPSSVVGLLDTE